MTTEARKIALVLLRTCLRRHHLWAIHDSDRAAFQGEGGMPMNSA
jgi:hypothetical protein